MSKQPANEDQGSWFPETLKLRFVSKGTGLPASGIFSVINIIARIKNGYNIFEHGLSDERGEVTVSRSFIEGEVNRTLTAWLMDYHDRLNECQPIVGIEVPSSAEINAWLDRIESDKEFQLIFRTEGRNLPDVIKLRKNMNHLYHPERKWFDFSRASYGELIIPLAPIG